MIVRVRQEKSGDARLVAYVVACDGELPTVSAMRRHIQAKLPHYMVPSAYVIMDALPLAPNGKIHLKALPAPGRGRPRLDVPFAPPRTPVERAVTEIWAQVLGLDELGVDDEFVDLGGNSLMATQVASRVLDRFKIGVPAEQMLSAATAGEMALRVTQALADRGAPP